MKALSKEQKLFVQSFVNKNGGDECSLELLVEMFERTWAGSFRKIGIAQDIYGYSEDDGVWLLEQILVQD